MASNYDDSDDATYEEKEEIDWNEYTKRQHVEAKTVDLELKDYLALGVAAMQTIFLPLIILAIVFLGFAFVLNIFW